MKDAIKQFYALFREAMFAAKLTASDISARKGVHYTYVYNSIRQNSNVTLSTADSLAQAAGYRMVISFEPIDGSPALVGNMDPNGPLYSERKRRTATTPVAEPEVEAAPSPAAAPEAAKHDLDAEIEALLADA